jgi:hypothetical protein
MCRRPLKHFYIAIVQIISVASQGHAQALSSDGLSLLENTPLQVFVDNVRQQETTLDGRIYAVQHLTEIQRKPEKVTEFALGARKILHSLDEKIEGNLDPNGLQVCVMGGKNEVFYSYARIFGSRLLKPQQFSFLPISRSLLKKSFESEEDSEGLLNYYKSILQTKKRLIIFDTVSTGYTFGRFIYIFQTLRKLGLEFEWPIFVGFYEDQNADYHGGIGSHGSIQDYLNAKPNASSSVHFVNIGRFDPEFTGWLWLPRRYQGKYESLHNGLPIPSKPSFMEDTGIDTQYFDSQGILLVKELLELKKREPNWARETDCEDLLEGIKENPMLE